MFAEPALWNSCVESAEHGVGPGICQGSQVGVSLEAIARLLTHAVATVRRQRRLWHSWPRMLPATSPARRCMLTGGARPRTMPTMCRRTPWIGRQLRPPNPQCLLRKIIYLPRCKLAVCITSTLQRFAMASQDQQTSRLNAAPVIEAKELANQRVTRIKAECVRMRWNHVAGSTVARRRSSTAGSSRACTLILQLQLLRAQLRQRAPAAAAAVVQRRLRPGGRLPRPPRWRAALCCA